MAAWELLSIHAQGRDHTVYAVFLPERRETWDIAGGGCLRIGRRGYLAGVAEDAKASATRGQGVSHMWRQSPAAVFRGRRRDVCALEIPPPPNRPFEIASGPCV